jgi:hypothetical protein
MKKKLISPLKQCFLRDKKKEFPKESNFLGELLENIWYIATWRRI